MNILKKLDIIKRPKRPNIAEYIENIFDSFIELHGDRYFADDPAIMGGIGKINGRAVTVIGHRRGKNTKENIKFRFAMPQPDGYRKALRLAKQAEKFNRPVICFVDTAGAYPGADAEKRGQGEAIAKCLYDFSTLKVPVITIVTGEGGSGGALALSIANEIYILENAVYSVISPRAFASILWRDASREQEAAVALKMEAEDLYNFGICDGIISEGTTNEEIYENVKATILNSLLRLTNLSPEEIQEKRYQKFRKIGSKLKGD